MKKLRIGLSILAIAIAAGSVATSEAASAESNAPVYNWTTYDPQGNPTGTVTGKTQAQMEQTTGCETPTSSICARAFDSQGHEVPSANLYFAQ